MDEVTIKPLRLEDLAQADGWPRGSAQTLLKLPSQSVSGGNLIGWAATSDNQVLGVCYVTFDQNQVGYLEVRVKPNQLRQGIGTSLTSYVVTQPQVEAINHLHALVELNNIAAQKILDQHKFSRIGYSPDGRIEYARHP